MSSFNEGNTKYRVARIMQSRQYKVTSETFIGGKSLQFQHRISDIGQDASDALAEGVAFLRPKIARAEAAARGEDIGVPPHPAIDAAVERERKAAQARAEAEADAQVIREAAARFLDEQHPLWGSF